MAVADTIVTIFTVINTILVFVMAILLLIGFISTLSAYLKIRKNIAKDQARIQNGETVLFGESFAYELLKYANTDYRANPEMEDPLSIHKQLNIAKWIFQMTQLLIMITLLGLVVYIFMVVFVGSKGGNETAGSETGSIKSSMFDFAVPFLFATFISVTMIIYVKAIYHPKYTETLLPDINKLYSNINDVNGIKSLIATNMSSKTEDPMIYTWLKTSTNQQIQSKIIGDSPNKKTLIRRIVTMSLYDYFKQELPNYDQSPVRQLFDSTTQNFDTVNPMDYIRLDCSRVIENYAYKYDLKFDPSTTADLKMEILNEVSTIIESINEKIAKIRIDIQPVLLYLENFFRAGFVYMMLMSILVLLAVLRYYNIHIIVLEIFSKINEWVFKPVWNKLVEWWGKLKERFAKGTTAPGAPAVPGAP
jgi:hypothetical protein